MLQDFIHQTADVCLFQNQLRHFRAAMNLIQSSIQIVTAFQNFLLIVCFLLADFKHFYLRRKCKKLIFHIMAKGFGCRVCCINLPANIKLITFQLSSVHDGMPQEIHDNESCQNQIIRINLIDQIASGKRYRAIGDKICKL